MTLFIFFRDKVGWRQLLVSSWSLDRPFLLSIFLENLFDPYRRDILLLCLKVHTSFAHDHVVLVMSSSDHAVGLEGVLALAVLSLAVFAGVVAVVHGAVHKLVSLLGQHVEGVRHQKLLFDAQLCFLLCLWVYLVGHYGTTSASQPITPNRFPNRLLWIMTVFARTFHRPERYLQVFIWMLKTVCPLYHLFWWRFYCAKFFCCFSGSFSRWTFVWIEVALAVWDG